MTRTCIVVAGMHRSGTSALTRTLNLLGCSISDDLVAGRKNDNPLGFWEASDIVALNKDIHASIGTSWDDWRPISEDWYQSKEKKHLLERAVQLIEDDYAGQELFTVKDPRFCRLLPFWREALDHCGIRTAVAIGIRHPLEVAGSVERRNGVPKDITNLSWLRHVLEAEANSRDLPRTIVRYEDLLRDWRQVFDRIGRDLGITWPKSYDDAESEVAEYLRPSERHNRIQENNPDLSQKLSPWILDTLDIHNQWAANGVDTADYARLDQITREFNSSVAAYSEVSHFAYDLAKQKRELAKERDRFAIQSKEHAETASRLMNREAELARLSSEIARIRSGGIPVRDSTISRLWKSVLINLTDAWRLIRLEANMEKLRGSELFDEKWYSQTYPDAAMSKIAPEAHYLLVGSLVERNPSASFNASSYLDAHPKLRKRRFNPLLHHLSRTKAGKRPADLAQTQPAPLADDEFGVPNLRNGHFGTELYKTALAAENQMAKPGKNPVYDSVRKGLDTLYYITNNPGILQSKYSDIVTQFIKRGDRKGIQPVPYFLASTYKSRNPNLGRDRKRPYQHYLRTGRNDGLLGNPFPGFDVLAKSIGREPQEVEERYIQDFNDLQERLRYGKLGEMVAQAANLEPLVERTWPRAFQPHMPPFHSPEVTQRLSVLMKLQSAAKGKQAEAVVLVNRPRWGGARRMEGHIAHALGEKLGAANVVLIATDHGGSMPPGKLPDGARYVDFASVAGGLPPPAQQRILIEFLRSLQVKKVFNVNSRTFWDSLKTFGKALSKSTDIYPCFFCNEQTPLGYWTGYPLVFFYRYFDICSGICVDSHYLAEWFRSTYKVPPALQSKIAVLEAPVDPSIPVARAPDELPERRRQVYWSGRFDKQKRVDLVYEIARRMPEVDFRMWGEAVMQSPFDGLERPENVHHEGKYERFEDLEISKADVWLYTAEWDGVPSVLLEVAMTGLPIAGSIAGGTGEVIQDGLAWPVYDIDDIDGYVDALRGVFADTATARSRASDLRKNLIGRRTREKYREEICNVIDAGGSHVEA